MPPTPRKPHPRLTDAETRERMLTAGRNAVAEGGMSIGLDWLSMEDLIRAAGVSRTSSYRRWPTKEAYVSDLLVDIAEATTLLGDDAHLLPALQESVPTVLAALQEKDGRRAILVELLRTTLTADYTQTLDSPSWRTYLAVRAGLRDLPDGELRTAVATALGRTAARFNAVRSRSLATIAELTGHRLAPIWGSWDEVALALGHLWTGSVLAGYVERDAQLTATARDPFGTGTASWTDVAVLTARLHLSSVQLAPASVWTTQRRDVLTAMAADPTIALAGFLPS